MEEEKEAEERGLLTKKQQQQNLNFKTVTGPVEFTREGVLHAVTVLIATNYQVKIQYMIMAVVEGHLTHLQPLSLADNPAFRNSLVSMRPKSTKLDLPSSYDVKVYLHNEFVKHMKNLKEEITVSPFFSPKCTELKLT
jgi:hypothetical protein